MSRIEKQMADVRRSVQREWLWGGNSKKQAVWWRRRQGVIESELIVERWRPSIFWRITHKARGILRGA